ncbi:hypothetical protein Zm00014a_036884 [Zea mays]|nr:hypothetical protein Zm00014a_036884 [Zea mays]
MLRFSKH